MTKPTLYAAIAAILQPTVIKPTDALYYADRINPDDGVSPTFGRAVNEQPYSTDRTEGGVCEYEEWFYDGDIGWEV